MAKKIRSTRRKAPARARPKSGKKYLRRASRARIKSLTLNAINRALVAAGDTTNAAKHLGISPRTLMREIKALRAQKAAEDRAVAPPPPASPPPPLAPTTMDGGTPGGVECADCPHPHIQGTECPNADCNCGDEVDDGNPVPDGNASDCDPMV